MGFGLNIKNARISKGLTQKKLAELLDVSTRTIQNYESEHREPNYAMLNKIANVFSLHPVELFDVDLDYLDGSSDKKNVYVLSSFSSNLNSLLQEIAIKDDIETNDYLAQIVLCLDKTIKSTVDNNFDELYLFRDYIGMFYEYTCKLKSENKNSVNLEFLNNKDVLTHFNELISIIKNTNNNV